MAALTNYVKTDIFDKQVQQVSSKADEGSAQLGGVMYIIGSLTTRDRCTGKEAKTLDQGCTSKH